MQKKTGKLTNEKKKIEYCLKLKENSSEWSWWLHEKDAGWKMLCEMNAMAVSYRI